MDTTFDYSEADEQSTPPSSVSEHSSPQSDKEQSQVTRILSLFQQIYSGRCRADLDLWNRFQLQRGEFEEIQRKLQKNESLLGFVLNQIRCVCTHLILMRII